MNTLNNIHALIDIDTEKAKETVIGLSKMMRYVLYDSSQPTISLEKEVFFIQNYIELMKLRYIDKVNIKLYLPEVIPSVQIPPLLFISFLENAFKHGISYRKDSYISFSLQVNERDIECLVTNSNCDHISHDNEQGIGLENVRKRLNLLYPDNYTLKIDSTIDEFSVLLIIPLL
jgi:Putative regulator of cell autolysis